MRVPRAASSVGVSRLAGNTEVCLRVHLRVQRGSEDLRGLVIMPKYSEMRVLTIEYTTLGQVNTHAGHLSAETPPCTRLFDDSMVTTDKKVTH